MKLIIPIMLIAMAAVLAAVLRDHRDKVAAAVRRAARREAAEYDEPESWFTGKLDWPPRQPR
jgi:hypothetical protein